MAAGGDRGRRRAGDHARGDGSLGGALAPADRAAATTTAAWREEIVAVTVPARKGDVVVEQDEAPRRDTTLESLAKLPPIFVKDGSHTAGNSPGVNDGAGAIVVASEAWAPANGREPLGDDRRDGAGRRRLPLPRAHPRPRRAEGAREGRARAVRGRSLGDQRGVRLGRDRLDPHARDRRGPRQRQRRRGRARPPDRRLRRAHPRQRSCTSCAAAAAASAVAAICSGGAQGDAVIVRA